MKTADSFLSRVRQPEYTGENRCLPCTVVNIAIAGVVSVLVGVGASTAGGVVGIVAGVVVLSLCLAAIYFRGYLVPGTPELTKRYFPEWLLALFGKQYVDGGQTGSRTTDASTLDPEAELTAIDALEECPDGPDLCLTDDFRADWQAAITRVRDADAERRELLGLLDVDDGEVEYEEYGAAFQAFVDEMVVGKWESRAAFLADLGAASILERRHPDWESLGIRERSQLLNGLRLFVDACPTCGGTPEFGTDTVESCCSTHEVAAVACTDCGARLFESNPL
jgi:hypothetical protein